jgi:hypothetical protein
MAVSVIVWGLLYCWDMVAVVRGRFDGIRLGWFISSGVVGRGEFVVVAVAVVVVVVFARCDGVVRVERYFGRGREVGRRWGRAAGWTYR